MKPHLSEMTRLKPGPGTWLEQPVQVLTKPFKDRFGFVYVVVESEDDGLDIARSDEVRNVGAA